ncbi:hypothetical protein AMS62_09100 [Bacillus sp. FJAT-18019]|nr:hypothetical protein AMS62_09100 [Bacillus sp. FJAT-18019]
MSITHFAQLSGINSGSLSRILHNDKPMSIRQLKLITAAMNLAEDHFFSQYVEECLSSSALTWRRLRPFIIICAELNRLDCIDRLVGHLLDNLSYISYLFEVAEELFVQRKFLAARILFKAVSESEKYQHSERLALCQYRLFVIALSDDLDSNLKAATIFQSHVHHLDISHRLDALYKLAHVYGSLELWNEVESIAQELHRIATIQYQLEYPLGSEQQLSKFPAYFYILYSYLTRSVVYEEQAQYDKALFYVDCYEDTSWIKVSTDESKAIIQKFKDWAIGNRLLYRLLSGHIDVLNDYVDYISVREQDIPTGLFRIVQVANHIEINIDHILERFSDHIPYRPPIDYNNPIRMEQHARLLIQLGIYYMRNNRDGGIDYVLQALEICILIKSNNNIIRCMSLFSYYNHKNNMLR